MFDKSHIVFCLFAMMTTIAADEFDESFCRYLTVNRKLLENSKNWDNESVDSLYRRTMDADRITYEAVILMMNIADEKYRANDFCK